MTRAYGFTLIELMVTLSIMAILMAIALPNFQSFIQNSRMTTQANNFITALMLARSEAVKRGSTVTVCSSTNGMACSGLSNWENGWLVFVDADGDGVVDAGDLPVQAGQPLAGGNTLKSGRAATRVTYSGNGFTAGFNDTFSLCDSRGAAFSRRILLSNQGRVRIETGGGVC